MGGGGWVVSDPLLSSYCCSLLFVVVRCCSLWVGCGLVVSSVTTRALACAVSRVDAALAVLHKKNNNDNNNNDRHPNDFNDTDSSDDDGGIFDGGGGEGSNKDNLMEYEMKKHQVEIMRLYPDSVCNHVWRGCYHSKTGVWREGLLHSTLSRIQNDRFGAHGIHFKHSHSQKWLVLDGSPRQHNSDGGSPSWYDDVASLFRFNADAKTSSWSNCLGTTLHANGQLRIILETDTLKHLSPAQLHLPLVHCNTTGLEWQDIVTAWLRNIRVSHPSLRRVMGELTGMLSLLLPSTVQWMSSSVSFSSSCPVGGCGLASCSSCVTPITTTKNPITAEDLHPKEEEEVDALVACRFVTNFLHFLNMALSPFCPLKGRTLSRRVAEEAKRTQKQASLSLITRMKQPLAEEWDPLMCRKHVQGLCLSTFMASTAVFVESTHHEELCGHLTSLIQRRESTGGGGGGGGSPHGQDMGNRIDQSWRPRWLDR